MFIILTHLIRSSKLQCAECWCGLMGAARSALRRTVRATFETERRLEKVLGSDPEPAGKHQSTKDLLEKAKQENQAKFDEHNRKNEEFLDLLKRIHVDSVDISEEKNKKYSDSESPSEAEQAVRLSSEKLLFLFRQRLANPEEWTEEKIATHFGLPPTSVENLLKFYCDFSVETPPPVPEPLEEIKF